MALSRTSISTSVSTLTDIDADPIIDAGRVYEEWDSCAALDTHFAAPHMREWQTERVALGFSDREVGAYEIGAVTPL